MSIEMDIEVRKAYHKNGQLMYKRPYVNGLRHGLCEAWHDDGKLWYHHPYVNGDLHGLCEGWHKNGKRSELYFVLGFLEGEEILYEY